MEEQNKEQKSNTRGWIELLVSAVLFVIPFFLNDGNDPFFIIFWPFWFFSFLIFILGALDVLKGTKENKNVYSESPKQQIKRGFKTVLVCLIIVPSLLLLIRFIISYIGL